PLERGSFAIGSVSALDTFLTTDSVPGIENDAEEGPLDPEEFEADWKDYQAGCARMLEQVCPGQLADRDVLEAVDYAFLLKKDSIKGTSRHILALYDHVRSHSSSAPLFDRYASEAIHAAEPCLPAHALFSARCLGSSARGPRGRDPGRQRSARHRKNDIAALGGRFVVGESGSRRGRTS